MRQPWVTAVLVGALAAGAGAQGVPPGVDAGSFSRIGVGGRALALGGAYVAIAEGPTAGYWNPAGLAQLEALSLEAMYTNWLGADIHYQHLGGAGQPPFLSLGGTPIALALNWLSVSIPDIPWEEEGVYGTFTAWSHLVLLSAGWSLPWVPEVSVGLTGKVYHDRILEGRSWGLGVDLGLLWRGEIAGLPLQLGISTTDVGTTRVQWYGTPGEPATYAPWLVRAGAALRLGDDLVTLAASVERGVDRPRFERLRAGAELLLDWLRVGIGWNQPLYDDPGYPASWTLGLEIGIAPWATLEYAFIPVGNRSSHWLGLRLAF